MPNLGFLRHIKSVDIREQVETRIIGDESTVQINIVYARKIRRRCAKKQLSELKKEQKLYARGFGQRRMSGGFKRTLSIALLSRV